MFTPSDSQYHRIVSRYLSSQSSCGSGPNRRAFVWEPLAPKPHIPDDIVLQCSYGCTLTALEIEGMLPAKLKVAPDSCRIDRIPANAEANRTRFEVRTVDGKKVTGTITVCMLASEQRVDAFTVVDLDA